MRVLAAVILQLSRPGEFSGRTWTKRPHFSFSAAVTATTTLTPNTPSNAATEDCDAYTRGRWMLWQSINCIVMASMLVSFHQQHLQHHNTANHQKLLTLTTQICNASYITT
jgi:hypothetical protein